MRYPEFEGPAWLCRFVRYLQMFPMYTSPFLLVAISFDRFQAICHPLQTYCSNRYRRPNYFAMIAWITALICSIPQLFIWHKTWKSRQILTSSTLDQLKLKREYGECATIYGHGVSFLKSIYVISFNTIAWLIPSVLSAFFYYQVCKAVWLSRRNHQLLLQLSQSAYVNSDFKKLPRPETESYIIKLHSDSRYYHRQFKRFNRERVQTIRFTMTIIFCNFFLWAPFCVVNVLQAVAPQLLSAQLITYIVILGNLNSCVNPWIYIIFNRNQVKRAFTSANANNARKP
uniref:G-protein coupled receptors family 1 profile domain-containing protein n=1 Tax=Setaria digitata TaxID=48799 RepID=A0A915PLR5_9BILA